MNYRHIYHAGVFADVVKHVVLIDLIKALQQKEKGFCFIDTHAGIGRYDLGSHEANKTREYEMGIEAVLTAPKIPMELEAYVKLVKQFNASCVNETAQQLAATQKNTWPARSRETAKLIHYYPGSPCVARKLLRSQDRMILNELHPEDFNTLKQEFWGNPQASVHQRDAYEFLPAMLPPAEKRGLILIDPAFEQLDELQSIISVLKKSLARFATGTYAIWLPIKDRSYLQFYAELRDSISQEILVADIALYNLSSFMGKQSFGLAGCALLIINPPWQIEMLIEKQFAWLWKQWTRAKTGQFNVKLL